MPLQPGDRLEGSSMKTRMLELPPDTVTASLITEVVRTKCPSCIMARVGGGFVRIGYAMCTS